MEAREDKAMTEVSSTGSEAIRQTQKKDVMRENESRRDSPALHEKGVASNEQRREAELLHLRRLEERAARIEELRTRVCSGTYKIDSLTVAQRIQDSALMPVIMGKGNGKLPRLPRLSRPRGAY